jgi:citrate lyase subunit beta/citryl-CoA lyase
MGGGASEDGDLARNVGFQWSAGGSETLYIRSKVLVDVTAAGVPNPMTGLVSALADPGAVEAFARQSRALGYQGMMVIHPAHVGIVNRVFTPTADEVARAAAVIAALDAAADSGVAALVHDGRMVDTAMARSAALVMRDAERVADLEQPDPPAVARDPDNPPVT